MKFTCRNDSTLEALDCVGLMGITVAPELSHLEPSIFFLFEALEENGGFQ